MSPTINTLNKSIAEMDIIEKMKLITKIRASRLVSKRKPRKKSLGKKLDLSSYIDEMSQEDAEALLKKLKEE